ncbi:hypothetical protein G7Y89_g8229 [Cudoniella acicularis]|uniref:RRM domain-containing protein n=1 Tax=Cudoniella acicularis TaxID=354080 RepID=A0A8H4W318_9HELO|nr:hypothetical protein G7Y89_g8229 [Cudoniella acicularis]
MASFNHRKTFSVSPHSSSGSAQSLGGTPESKITAFSPDDCRSVNAKPMGIKTSNSPQKASQHDPFVTSAKPNVKLSATASSFQPFGFRNASTGPSPPILQASTLPPEAAEFFKNEILAVSETTQIGTFTADTGASRYLKISSLYGAPKLYQSSWTLKGSLRETVFGNTVYMRLSNVSDAANIYGAVKADNLETLAVEYMNPAAWASVCSPDRNGELSSYEGQVLLEVQYPAHRNFSASDRKAFEDSLRALLVVEGTLCAWQTLSTEGSDVYRLRAEFYDSSFATRAIKRLDGQRLGGSDVFIRLRPHHPDRHIVPQQKGPATTPTRRTGDLSSLTDALGGMSLNNTTPVSLHENIVYSPTAITPNGITNLAYIPANGTFPMPQGSVPVVLGGVYPQTPVGATIHQPIMTAMQPPAQLNGNAIHTISHPLYGQTVYPFTGIEQASLSPLGFQQHSPRTDYGYSPASAGSSRDMVPYRPSGRRQNAVKVHPGPRRNHSNPAAGQHNHVDIKKIQEGSDVRTTVMLRNIPNKVDQAMLKSIVDESSFGRYDFMYLRIDFSNNCNVGYAFINFVDPLDIINFVLARSNQKWHRFKSDKVAEVSYARP